ncbi:polysaccharide lyase family 7 protein [Kozakia baliensis]|uniref:polysaccharide lyase family 7 protein n=1 Tax=Kozakia baliensis TaxID=153496 RepID=UPI00345B608E
MRKLFLIPAFALVFGAGASAQTRLAPASINAPSFDTTGFDLQEIQSRSVTVVPGARLQAAYTDASYRPIAGGAALASDAIKPSSYHALQPRTELAENQRWRWQDGVVVLGATLHIDAKPRRGTMVLAEIVSDKNEALLRLTLDGDRVVAALPGRNGEKFSGVVGTVNTDGIVSYNIETRPEGTMRVDVNGTGSFFLVDPSRLALPVSFHTGAQAQGDVGKGPDKVQVSFSRLTARHYGVASNPRA